MRQMKQFIIFDTEFTTWEGAMANNWSESWQHREIFQIGALKIRDGEIVGTFDCLIKPQENPILSDYAVDLTGVTNEQIAKKGISFVEAYKQFLEFVGELPCYSNAASRECVLNSKCRADGDIMDENLVLNSMTCEKGPCYKNIASNIYQLAEEKGVPLAYMNSGAMATALGLDEEMQKYVPGGEQHNALYDCYSLFVTWTYLNNL